LREYTRYALQEIIQPFELEKLIPEILFNRNYPDIRRIGGTNDFGHDAVSITWIVSAEKFSKIVFAFSKRNDWKKKFCSDIRRFDDDKTIVKFVFVTTENVGAYKLPKNLMKLKDEFGFSVEIIDIDDLVTWLDNTSWGYVLKEKYGISQENSFLYLKSYDEVLLTEDDEPEYFRMRGPIDVDFANDMVYQRNELKSLIYKLDSNNLHIIIGLPASGKTVLVRNICWKLKNIYQIYWLDIIDLEIDQTKVLSEIRRLNMEKSLLVVEDAHKSLEKLEMLLKYIKYNLKNIKLLVTARKNSDIDRLDYRENRFVELRALTSNPECLTEIFAKDIAKDLIQFYSARFNKNISTGSFNIGYLKDDLWYLSYLLKAWADYGSLDEQLIIQKIYDDLIDYNNRFGQGSTDIILIISLITSNPTILSKENATYFEDHFIPIDDYILVDKLGYDPIIISNLVKNGLVKKDHDCYWCWHTSLSLLFIQVSETYPNLLKRINSKFRDILGDSFDDGLESFDHINKFHVYLRLRPEYASNILAITANNTFNLFKIFNDIKSRELTYSSLKNGRLRHINSIGNIIFGIRMLEHCENYREYKEYVFQEIMQNFGPNVIEDKIRECHNPTDIIEYIIMINNIDSDVAESLLNNYSSQIITDLDSRDIRLDDIGMIIELSSKISPKLPEQILRKNSLISEKMKYMNIYSLNYFLNDLNISRIYTKKYGQESFDRLERLIINTMNDNFANILSCIIKSNAEYEIGVKGIVLNISNQISKIDMLKGEQIIESSGIDTFTTFISSIDDLNKLRYIIYSLENLKIDYKIQLLKSITKIIENDIRTKGVFYVRYFFGNIYKDETYHFNRDYNTLNIIFNIMDQNIVKTLQKLECYPFKDFFNQKKEPITKTNPPS